MAWLKRWLPQKKYKLSHNYKKMQLDDNEPKPEISTALGQLPTVYIKEFGYIPAILMNASLVIQKNIRTKGLFQTKGHDSQIVASILSRHRKGRIKKFNVHDVVEVMKSLLIRQGDSLLPSFVCNALIKASNEDCASKYIFVLKEFRDFSPYHFAILHFVMRLLNKISEHSAYNGMSGRKLAVVFVLDVIRPIEQGVTTDQEQFVTEFVQRLPFLVSVVENLIQNVDVFKMVCSHDGGASPSRDFQQDHESAEPCDKSKRTTTEGYADNNVDLFLSSSQTEHKIHCGDLGSVSFTITASNESIQADESSSQISDASSNIVNIQGNNAVQNDFVTHTNDVTMPNISKPSSPEFKKNQTAARQHFKIASGMKSSLTKSKSTKTNKVQSSPDKKPQKKLTVMSKKKKKTFCTRGKKEHDKQGEVGITVQSQDSPNTSGRLQEVPDSWTKGCGNSDDINGINKASKNQRTLTSIMSPTKKMKDVAEESLHRQQMLGQPTLQYELTTEDHGKRLDVMSTSSNEAITTVSSFPLSKGMRDASPHRSTGMTNTSPLQSPGMRDTAPPQTTGMRDTTPPQTTGMRDTTPPQTTGMRDIPPHRSTGKRDTSLPNSTRTTRHTLKETHDISDISGHENITGFRRCSMRQDTSIAGEAPHSTVSLVPAREMTQLVPDEGNTMSTSLGTCRVSRDGRTRNRMPCTSEICHHARGSTKSSTSKSDRRTSFTRDVEASEIGREVSQFSANAHNVGVNVSRSEEDAPVRLSVDRQQLPVRDDNEIVACTSSPQNLVVTVRYTGSESPARSSQSRKRRVVKRSAIKLLHQGVIDHETLSWGLSIGKWLVDILLASMILLCLYLILQVLQYGSCEEDWLYEQDR